MQETTFVQAGTLARPKLIGRVVRLLLADDRIVMIQNRRLAVNRELLIAELPKAGFTDLAPADGAFYIYADVGHLTNDSEDFCRRILNEAGVAVTPGVDFDPWRGNRFVRFSFAESTKEIAAAAALRQRHDG